MLSFVEAISKLKNTQYVRAYNKWQKETIRDFYPNE